MDVGLTALTLSQIALQDCIRAVQDDDARLDRLTRQIKELLPSSSPAHVVKTLQGTRGILLVAAVLHDRGRQTFDAPTMRDSLVSACAVGTFVRRQRRRSGINIAETARRGCARAIGGLLRPAAEGRVCGDGLSTKVGSAHRI